MVAGSVRRNIVEYKSKLSEPSLIMLLPSGPFIPVWNIILYKFVLKCRRNCEIVMQRESGRM